MQVLLEAKSRQYFKLDVMVGRLYPPGMNPDINIVIKADHYIKH